MAQYTVSRNDFPPLMSATDLQALGMSRTMAYRMLNNTDVPAISIGGRRFMNRDRFFEWLDRNTNEAVDAVSVVRCGKCKFARYAGFNTAFGTKAYWCVNNTRIGCTQVTDANDYCSYGEFKSKEERI